MWIPLRHRCQLPLLSRQASSGKTPIILYFHSHFDSQFLFSEVQKVISIIMCLFKRCDVVQWLICLMIPVGQLVYQTSERKLCFHRRSHASLLLHLKMFETSVTSTRQINQFSFLISFPCESHEAPARPKGEIKRGILRNGWKQDSRVKLRTICFEMLSPVLWQPGCSLHALVHSTFQHVRYTCWPHVDSFCHSLCEWLSFIRSMLVLTVVV